MTDYNDPKILARLLAALARESAVGLAPEGWTIDHNMGAWWTYKQGGGETGVRRHRTLAGALRRVGLRKEALALEWAVEVSRPTCLKVVVSAVSPCSWMDVHDAIQAMERKGNAAKEIHIHPSQVSRCYHAWEMEIGADPGHVPTPDGPLYIFGKEIVPDEKILPNRVYVAGGVNQESLVTTVVLCDQKGWKTVADDGD